MRMDQSCGVVRKKITDDDVKCIGRGGTGVKKKLLKKRCYSRNIDTTVNEMNSYKNRKWRHAKQVSWTVVEWSGIASKR